MDFNTQAANWDTEGRENRAKIIANEIIKSVDVKENRSALEFGCGTGLVSFNLADKFEHITLIDTSEGMIEKVKQKLQDSRVKNMTAFRMDISEGNVLKDKFDVIYTSMALHHIMDTKAVLKSLYELLNEGGALCIVELDEEDGSFHKLEKDFKGHNGFNQEALKAIMRETGFKSVVSNTFYNDFKVIDDEKIEYSLFLMVGKR